MSKDYIHVRKPSYLRRDHQKPQICQDNGRSFAEGNNTAQFVLYFIIRACIRNNPFLFAALNSKERIYYNDASSDSRFASEAGQSVYRSVLCLPIFSNRGQTFGAVYFASKYPFPRDTVTILTLLCQQASISISNALLFRSVQAGTRENLKMIAAQREALEAARKSREDALKATKVCMPSYD